MTEQPDQGADATAAASCTVGEEWFGRVAVLSVSGVVDMLTAPTLEEAITTALGKSPATLVVDLSDVEFLASAGMGVLVAANDQATPNIGFAVVADGPVTSRPLKLVGIADIVTLYPTLDEALSKLSA
ncbi:STAS domain-containing protein [Mycolicibacterium palauense]|uniref:STAS domain-containing protein n=1 Tax=Mycolicibacterium palauense TaxID=2034511 RepID=UPI001FE8F1C1|nr:STAS domain-containing protein [Mycolicibacterium palauense]